MKKRLTRRQFILGTATALAGATLACGRSRDVATLLAPTATPGAATSTPSPTLAPGSAADLILTHGKIITIDAGDTLAEAVAIKEGLVQAVGSAAEIAVWVGESTRIIELGGRAVTPGMIDPHNHFQVMGLMNGYYVPFLPPDVRSIEDLQARLSEVAAQTPEGEWIKGYFMVVSEARLPDRHDLDAAAPDHPVWIMQQGGHYGSANSLALQLAGITAATPDPVGGVIDRDERGEPNGVFYNHRAMDLLRRVIPPYTQDDVRQNILSTEPLFASCGVTSYHDNNVRGTETVATYMETGQRGELSLRGRVYYTLEWPADVDRALTEIEHYADPFMRFAGFKFLLDGQAHMAYCHEPHNGKRWDTPTWDPDTFKDAVRKLHDTGLQICVHCAGDAAVDLTLDAFEAAMNANPRPDPRHRIEHGILSTPQAIRRMHDLGVVVVTQPQFLRMGAASWKEIFGEARSRRAICTREWLDAGVNLALSSDAPTTPWYTPQVTLFGAVVRPDFEGQQHAPEQALTLQEALRAHTLGAAYAGHEEDIKGSIEVGKLADLVVWAEDPYTLPLKDLWQTPMAMTLVGGDIVYDGGIDALAPRKGAELLA